MRDVMRGAHEMSAGMERIERNDFDAALVVTDASEFAPLYEGFNTMAGQLEANVRANASQRDAWKRKVDQVKAENANRLQKTRLEVRAGPVTVAERGAP